MSRRRTAQGPSSSRLRRVVTARGPGDIIAAVPYLVGFVPARSLVLVSLRGARLRIGLVARVDLPAHSQLAEAAAALRDFVLRDNPREVLVLVYDDRPWPGNGQRPWQDLVDAVAAELATRDVPVREASYVSPDRYWSYDCVVPTCCPPEGRSLSETASSAVAAEYVLEGRSPYASRETLGQRLRPCPADLLAAVDRAIGEELDAATPFWLQEDSPAWLAWQRDSVRLFDEAGHRYLAGGAPLSVAESGRLLAGLLDLTTRDVVVDRWIRWFSSLSGPVAPQVDERMRLLEPEGPAPAVGDRADVRREVPAGADDAVERLFVDLAVRSEGLTASAPLTLLAMHAWSRGNGALAGVAVDRVGDHDPGYRMAALVDTLLRSGRPPRWAAQDQQDDEADPAAARSS